MMFPLVNCFGIYGGQELKKSVAIMQLALPAIFLINRTSLGQHPIMQKSKLAQTECPTKINNNATPNTNWGTRMSHKPETELTDFQGLAIRIADQDFKPSRPKVLNALTTLLNALELHRSNSAHLIQATVCVPGWLSELEEALLAFVCDPIGTALRSAIRQLGEVASKFMTIDEMLNVADEAAAKWGDPAVRGRIVNRQWDGLRDRDGDCWIA